MKHPNQFDLGLALSRCSCHYGVPKTWDWGYKKGGKPRKPLGWTRDGDCIICTSHSLSDAGYPQVRRDGKTVRISRYILFRTYGVQPPSICSRHTCDNPRCINPRHIIPGTQIDNVRDRAVRGRSALAESYPTTKLNVTLASEIKQLMRDGVGLHKIAPRYGVSYGTIRNIKIGRTWKYAP